MNMVQVCNEETKSKCWSKNQEKQNILSPSTHQNKLCKADKDTLLGYFCYFKSLIWIIVMMLKNIFWSKQ